MKKSVEMVKMFILSIVLAMMILPVTNCQAQSISITQFINHVKPGNWYDSNGNLVLTISNDYSINGCKILSVNQDWADTAISYTVRIAENNGYRDMNLISYRGNKFIILDEKIALRNTKNPHYFESVGGIYIGMDKNQVVSLYGQPSSSEYNGLIYKYNNEGMELIFIYNIVSSITIYRNGNRRFDWSGLSANNSRADFINKYRNISSHGGERSDVFIREYNEEISVNSNGSVTLSMP